MANTKAPKTLLEAVQFFADKDVAHDFVAQLRWPDDEQVCPKCGCIEEHYYLAKRRVWKCRACRKQFSVKVGTIFEDSPISLSKWLPAMWQIANCKNGISSYELARAIGVTQKTAWFMLHRIRLAMRSRSFDKFDGVDETFIGGKARNMHKAKRARVIKGTGGMGKVAVLGLLERHSDGPSQVRTTIIKSRNRSTIQPPIRQSIEPGAHVYTDALASYNTLNDAYKHKVIDHAECYAKGRVHTNGIENFWSCLKRALKGTYISVEPFHLFRYLDEQVFRFNARKDTDSGRFLATLRSAIAKRLTYAQLTGAELSRR